MKRFLMVGAIAVAALSAALIPICAKARAVSRDDGLTFGDALTALRCGAQVARSGWNGKGMFLFHVPTWTYTDGKQDNYPNLPFIAMKTADDKVIPWLASQSDILATDWVILDEVQKTEEVAPLLETVTPPTGIPGLVAGRVVYYAPHESEAFRDGPIVGLIVRVFDENAGTSNIRLLCDGTNQNPDGAREWVTSRLYDADGKPGTWRFLR